MDEQALHPVAIETSVPGKLILMGEHAAVYGRPAVVAALGLRTVATMSTLPEQSRRHTEPSLTLELPDLGHRETSAWADVIAYGETRRRLWQRYVDSPTPENFGALGTRDPAVVVKVALAETLAAVGGAAPSSRLSVHSELPLGAGFGSSASVAVAAIAALLGTLDRQAKTFDIERIAPIALEAERRQHGSPSGIDHTTVLRGGFLFLEKVGEELSVAEIGRNEWAGPGLQVYDTGSPNETTGEVVAQVRHLRDQDPDRFSGILEEMESQTRAFAAALSVAEPSWPGVLESVRRFERCLEDMGVVPESVRRAVRKVESAGGAAKISGAGALSGCGGGSLVIFWPPDLGEVPKDILGEFAPVPAALGVEGLSWSRDV